MKISPTRDEAELPESHAPGVSETDKHCFIVYVSGEPSAFRSISSTRSSDRSRDAGAARAARNRRPRQSARQDRDRSQSAPTAENAGRAGGSSMLAVGMEYRGENFALVVDEVGDVVHLDPEMQIPLPPHLGERRAKFTKAAYRLETGILSLLDVGARFRFPRHL